MNRTPGTPMAELLRIMAKLRDPERGCPWDVEQTFDSIAGYTIEEAYEVADAIDRRDFPALKDELGDLLLQVVFHARMAEEAGHFAFDDVVEAICDKLVRRHPHVFGDARIADAKAQTASWEAIKADERAQRSRDTSALADVPAGLPEWQRALKLQKRAARVGFEWPELEQVLGKLDEELREIHAEIAAQAQTERIEDELGDVLFVAVDLARHTGIDVSRALRRANAKFEQRFRRMEILAAAQGRRLEALSLAEQQALWQRAKADQRAATTSSSVDNEDRA